MRGHHMDATNTVQGYVPPSQLKVGQVLFEKKKDMVYIWYGPIRLVWERHIISNFLVIFHRIFASPF